MRGKGRALLFTGLVLGVAAGAAAAGHGPSSLRATKVHCKLPGVRYVGTTGQSQKLCFTLSANGKTLKEYSFGGRFKCDDGTRAVGAVEIDPDTTAVSVADLNIISVGAGETAKKITDIGKDGKFDGSIGLRSTGQNGFQVETTFTGQIKPAAGVLRLTVKVGDPTAPDIVCATGKATWKARRVA